MPSSCLVELSGVQERFAHTGERPMPTASFVTATDITCGASPAMPFGQRVRAYLSEAKYESIRALHVPSFAIPLLLLPVALYVFIGIFLAGSVSHDDPKTPITMFVNFAVLGVMGPALFGFGVFVAMEREQGPLALKRALPMRPAAYLFAKMFMAMLLAFIVMLTLVASAATLGDLHLTASQYLSITGIDILGALPFCAIGLFIGTRVSGKTAPAIANLAYLPMMHLGGLFFPLPRSVQPFELASPAFYLDKLGLMAAGAPSLDQLAIGVHGPSSQGSPILYLTVLVSLTALLTMISIRRLQRLK